MTKNTEVAVMQQNTGLPMTRPEAQENIVVPFVDICETPEAFVLILDMPGVSKESISATMDGGSLIVKGSVKPYHRENAFLLFNELRNASYYRVFNIGEGIDRSNVEAQFEHGVLTVKLFKSDELKSREIQIKY